MNTSSLVSLINLRGRVVWIARHEVELRRGEGWIIINNPRQDYYPQYDLSAGGQKATENLAENLDAKDVLPGVEL